MLLTFLADENGTSRSLTDAETAMVAQLYDAYASRIRYMAMRILKNDADADDALAEVFIRIIKYKEKFVEDDEKQNVRLIVLFTRSTCIDLYRRRERYQSLHTSITVEDEDGQLTDMEYADEGADIWTRILQRDAASRVKAALETLGSPAKEIIMLKYYGGMKNREIADFFGMKLPTVAVIIHRSMQKMRKQLEGNVNEDSQET